jgi:class 3 adenylate cyclase
MESDELPTMELPVAARPTAPPPAAPDQLRPKTEGLDHEQLRNLVKLRLILAGVDPDEVDQIEETTAPTLLRNRLLWGDDEPITLTEVAERSGLDVETCRRARMLMGLPDPGDAAVCRTQEIETFRGFAAGIELYGEEPILQFTRVLGSAMAMVAEGSLSVFGRQLADQEHPPVGDEYVLAAFDALESFRIVPDVLGIVAKLQFDLATDRLNGEPGQMRVATIGFVDLTDSTKATEMLGSHAMAPALTRFEEWAAELAVANGGRVVKYIGDEVMFLSPDLPAAARVATELLERVRNDEVLRSARAGLAHGPLLSRDGDWYGSTVNLASRLVDRAKPDTVLMAGEGADQVDGATARGRRRIRDLPERVELWRIA